ncbi:sensor histidine kinase [Novosphingobium terrae]|uniref:sensor histidine kinase n=1 Tax=Novosphingobium terrae TaxID=2726189 RepID=UPI001F12C43C|nr:HAMP domain-containing sensor histidine kinase [Novosphingobium terrae]
MNTRSIHGRLIFGAALTILLALGIAGNGLVWLFQRHIEQREGLSLEVKARELLPGLHVDAQARPSAQTLPSDSRFLHPGSGLYWQANAPGGVIRSRSLSDQSLSMPNPLTGDPSGETWSLRHTDGPFGHRLIVIARTIRPDAGRPPVLVQFATDGDALSLFQNEFRMETALALCLLWVVLVLAAVVQVRLGLGPFRRVGAELDLLRRNPAERLSTDHPREIAPLVEAINALADARAADLDRARHRAADLAHSLKTPLAALAAQSRRARAEGASSAADAIDRTIAVAQAALEAELARARSAIAREREAPARADVLATIEGVVAVVERTDAGSLLVFDIDVPAGIEAPLSSADLAEIIGALTENAARFARRRIAISAWAERGCIRIAIADDGPGMESDWMSRAMLRGQRLDEAGPGHGLGLPIAADLVAATGGTLSLTSGGASGGLTIDLSWPDNTHP